MTLMALCRGWLGRVETSQGDVSAFQGLSGALVGLAAKQGIRLHRRTDAVRPMPSSPSHAWQHLLGSPCCPCTPPRPPLSWRSLPMTASPKLVT